MSDDELALGGATGTDQAGPGRDLEDIAYAAWVWVPLESPDDIPGHWRVGDPSLDGQCRRLVRLTDAYGLAEEERSRFLSEVAYVQATTAGRVAVGASQGDQGMNKIWAGRAARRCLGIGHEVARLELGGFRGGPRRQRPDAFPSAEPVS